MTIALIAAIGTNRVIGHDNELPWYLPDELKRFKALTTGHPIIMGRKTYESIGKPLPNRLNIVITRDPSLVIDGCTVVTSFDEALEVAKKADPEIAFVIGGAQIYALALPKAARLYLTHVDTAPEGDILFPEFDESGWEVTEREWHDKDDKHPYTFEFRTYERKV
jgi:dihydrofolate reductase